ncbi:MAG: hypothetical protein EOP52_10650 [Sphingobacteriales bacterium]|nr:MAG: hypothetical protein EOP52_10650 [Sphingobacteriales bacterium]
MYRFTCAVSALLLFASGSAWAQSVPAKVRDTAAYDHQLRIGIDMARPLIHALSPNQYSYEVQADWAFRKEIYGVVEAGFGRYEADYADLSYQSTGAFIRIGADRGILRRLLPQDWDGGLFGLRYGFAAVNRGAAQFTTGNDLWGYQSGTEGAKTYGFHWIELTGGMRLEILKNIFAGWNIRGKFMITNLTTSELRPSYVAGFGQADRSTSFDFNVWLLYALRWSRK